MRVNFDSSCADESEKLNTESDFNGNNRFYYSQILDTFHISSIAEQSIKQIMSTKFSGLGIIFGE